MTGTAIDVLRRVSTLLCAFSIASWGVDAIAGQSTSLVPAYAAVLQRFNPELSPITAVELAETTIAEADEQGLDARLLVALIAVESSWRPQAVSNAGAVGLGQLMPGTAAGLGVDPEDARANIHGVATHLRALLTRYAALDTEARYIDALAAYNAGAGAVERYGGVPPYRETREYVRRVLALWRELAGV